MKVIKLDRRYAGFPKWKYACQFLVRYAGGRKEYFDFKQAFRDTYGLDVVANADRATGDYSKPMWIYNEHWAADYKRQRILFNDQAVITMIMLKMPG